MTTKVHQVIDWGDNHGVERIDQDTGCVDRFGRAIGYRAAIRQVETRESTTGSGFCIKEDLPFGTLYQWGVQTTRDGEYYGPIQNRYFAATKEAAKVAAMAKMNKLVKAVQKKYPAA